jgi:hypothetical protein
MIMQMHILFLLLLTVLQPSLGPGRFLEIFPFPPFKVLRLYPLTLSTLLPSVHLSFGLPTLLHRSDFRRVFFSIGLSSSIRIT